METKYSKEKFEGFTHRFIVQFEIGEPYHHNVDIYSNLDSYQKLEDYINDKKTKQVVSFNIVHRATKKQDEIASKLIDEVLDTI